MEKISSRRGKCRVALLLAATGGCGGGGNSTGTGGLTGKDAGKDAAFAVCSGTPRLFTPGLSVLSASGAYRATIQDATATDFLGITTTGAGIGHDTFSVTVTAAADGGAPASTDG